MIPSILLPGYFKWIGIVLAVSGYVGAAYYSHYLDDVNYPGGVFIQSAVLFGLLLIADAREKIEDEMVKHIRLTALQWSVLLFIILRVGLKSVAFYTQNTSWLPHIEVNFLLLLYLGFFYYQLYMMEHVIKLFKGNGK